MENGNSAVANRNTQTDMMIARQAQEVQVAMLSAKRFPRDELQAIDRIKKSCQRPTLANQAIYSYPRGGQSVSGPSIRLAEAVAQNWGNIDFGVIELERREGSSEMMAYAWDLETNTRSTKTFSVRHKRDTKQGSKDLTDERDIYEMAANQGARRVRSCIMNVVPGDVIEVAVQECRRTIADSDKRPINDILKEMLKAFKEIGVTPEMIERYMDKKPADLLKEELVDLRGAYKAIKDGQSSINDYFKQPVGATDDGKSAILNAKKKAAEPAPAPVAEQPSNEESADSTEHEKNVDKIFPGSKDVSKKSEPKQASLVDEGSENGNNS